MNGIYASSRGQMKFIMRAPTCKYADSKSGFNDMVGIEIRYRQGNLAVFFYWSDRRGGGCLPQRDGNECEIARSLVSSFRAVPPLFLVIVVYGIHAKAQKIARILCFPVISHSPFYRSARKISRFARNDDTGKAVFSFRSLPHWGRGTAPAVDRVLSLTAHLR